MPPIHARYVSCVVTDTRCVGSAFVGKYIAHLSSCERRVAICTAADTLHYLPVRDLYPIHRGSSSKCPIFFVSELDGAQ